MKENKVNITYTEDARNNTGDLQIKGDLNIKNADQIKKQLSKVKFDSSQVSIHIRAEEQMDLTFIQILTALKNQLKQEEKTVDVSFELSESLQKLITSSGIERILN